MMENEKATYRKVGDLVGVNILAQEQLKDLYDKGKALFDLVSKASPYIGAAQEVMKMIGILKAEKSQFTKLFEDIKAELAEISAKIDAVSKQSLGITISDIEASSSSIELAIEKWGKIYEDTGDRTIIIDLLSLAAQSTTSVERFKSPYMWKRTFDVTAVCTLAWGRERYTPVRQGGFVWEYRIGLPAYLDAIHARLSYVQLIEDIKYRENNETQFKEAIEELIKVYKLILSGIVLTPAPGPKLPESPSPQIDQPYPGNYIPPPPKTFGESRWEQLGKTCGAVDTYAGVAMTEAVPLQQPVHTGYYADFEQYRNASNIPASGNPLPHMLVKPQADFDKQKAEGVIRAAEEAVALRRFRLIFLIRALRARVQICIASGLPALWRTIQSLHAATWTPEAPGLETTLGCDTYHALRPVLQPSDTVLGQIFGADAALVRGQFDRGAPYSLRALAEDLTPPFANIPSAKPSPFFLGQYTGIVSLRRILVGEPPEIIDPFTS